MAQLEQSVTKATVHRRLRDERGLEASVASLKRWIAANLPEQTLRVKVTVLGEDPAPGQEAQIDYGYLGMWPTGSGTAASGVGVRDGAELLAAPVPAAGAAYEPVDLDRVPPRGVRLLRRGAFAGW